MEEDLILAKAELISGGAVSVPKGYRFPVRLSRSTAGPGAGNRSVVFSFNGMRVKKSVSDDGEFCFDPEMNVISRDGRIVARDVSIVPVAFHCPEQAFFNLDQRCRFNCLFCSSPHIEKDITGSIDGETIARMIRGCKGPIRSIALTTGIRDSVEGSVKRMIDCVRVLRTEFPGMPIGVEPYIDSEDQIDGLFGAGAAEIKINIETATDDLFKRFCPALDRNIIFDMLAHAVEVFGRGKVASNLIVGLGESDDDIQTMIERLCSMGVTPCIRGLRINIDVRDPLMDEGISGQPSPERLIRIAKIQKSMMERYSLDSRSFDTMCLRCTCCDLVPFIDL